MDDKSTTSSLSPFGSMYGKSPNFCFCFSPSSALPFGSSNQPPQIYPSRNKLPKLC